jgi:hypothetical protein
MASSSGSSIVVELMSSAVRMIYASGRLRSRDHPSNENGLIDVAAAQEPYLCVNVGEFILDAGDHRVEGLEAQPKEVSEDWCCQRRASGGEHAWEGWERNLFSWKAPNDTRAHVIHGAIGHEHHAVALTDDVHCRHAVSAVWGFS